MPLPTIATKTYTVTLPQAQTEVEYRPYLVKEERALLISNQSDKDSDVVDAIMNLLRACIIQGPRPEELTNVDFEWLFANIRAKSIGEDIEFTQKCSACEKDFDTSFNIEDIEIETGEDYSLEYIVDDTDIGIRFKSPTMADFIRLSKSPTADDDSLQMLKLIEESIYQVWDGEQVYTRGQDFSTPEEVSAFFDQLKSEHLKKIYGIVFESAPKMVQEFTKTCPHCKAEKEYRVEGLVNFFG